MQTLTPIIHSFNTNCVPDTVPGTMKWVNQNQYSRAEIFNHDVSAVKENHGINWWEERCSGACLRSATEMLYTNTFICVLAWKWYLRSIWDLNSNSFFFFFNGFTGHLNVFLQGKLSLLAQMVKILPAMQETWVRYLTWEDLLEKRMATHSSILAWGIPWTEEPGRLQFMELQSQKWLRD